MLRLRSGESERYEPENHKKYVEPEGGPVVVRDRVKLGGDEDVNSGD